MPNTRSMARQRVSEVILLSGSEDEGSDEAGSADNKPGSSLGDQPGQSRDGSLATDPSSAPAQPHVVARLRSQIKQVDTQLTRLNANISALLTQQQKLREERRSLEAALLLEQRAPRRDWAADTFPWDADVQRLLLQVFHIPEFRPLQRQVINATLQGRDVLCLLPSGGGKSLCYMLPALVSAAATSTPPAAPPAAPAALGFPSQLTLVVSPLLSLIEDQVTALEELRIPAAALTSLSTKEDTAAVFARLAPGASSLPRLLYVTPERVVKSKRLMSKLEKLAEAGHLVRIAVDEAHCMSAYGNDFRPDYKKLGVLRTMFPRVPILALTATATRQVQDDIRTILGTPHAELFSASINRPNLWYEVRHKPAATADATAELVSWISHNYPDGESGIVYTLTRRECETLCEELVAAGVSAVFYHADVDARERRAAHTAWARGEAQVAVATVAFGMGINKPDVRFVVHACMSKSVENYYQESGRAGRDGKPARCLLFYRFPDALRQAAIMCYEPNWWPNLQGMMVYASGWGTCRRAAVQRHFSEAPAECRRMCDACLAGKAGLREVNVRDAALGALRTAAGLPHAKGTLLQLLDAWRKAQREVCRALSRDEQEQVVQALLLGGQLELTFAATSHTTNVYLTPSLLGQRLLEHDGGGGGGPSTLVVLQGAAGGAAAGEVPATEAGLERESALWRWRARVAEREAVFAECVLTQRELAALAALPTITADAVAQVLENPASHSSVVELVAELSGDVSTSAVSADHQRAKKPRQA